MGICFRQAIPGMHWLWADHYAWKSEPLKCAEFMALNWSTLVPTTRYIHARKVAVMTVTKTNVVTREQYSRHPERYPADAPKASFTIATSPFSLATYHFVFRRWCGLMKHENCYSTWVPSNIPNCNRYSPRSMKRERATGRLKETQWMQQVYMKLATSNCWTL